jgi:hypothetical protein
MKTAGYDFWKMALSLLVGVFLCAMAATFYVAADRMSPVTDTDYYSHGLHYGQTASGASNPGIRWTLSPSLSGSDLKVCVSDASGAKICGGVLRFSADNAIPRKGDTGKGDRHLLAKEPVPSSILLAESSPGIFTAPRPVSTNGELRGTLLYTRGEAVATQKMVLLQ